MEVQTAPTENPDAPLGQSPPAAIGLFTSRGAPFQLKFDDN